MSYSRAIDLINLNGKARCGQQETLDHPAFMGEILSRDPWADPYRAYIDTYCALDTDWVLGIPRPHLKPDTFAHASSIDLGRGRRMTEWGLAGSSWQEDFSFHTTDQVLAYDPLTASDFEESIAQHALATWDALAQDQQELGNATLISGMHYQTLFQACIMTFGWPLFLESAASEPERFQHVLTGFAERSRLFLHSYATRHPPLVLIHDDIAMQRGLVFRPEWYRRHLFPLYESLLEPLFNDPSIRVGFVSDGDYSVLLPDLAALGFHGFLINPNMPFRHIARSYGRDHFLVGNVDTSVLTFGTPLDVIAEVQRCFEDAQPCAGFFIKAMGDLPHNIPLANMHAYFTCCRELIERG